jgi:RimJ/RimL family protein N-acetyltransferase
MGEPAVTGVLRVATAADLDALLALARRPEVAESVSTDAPDGIVAALDDDEGELLAIEHEGALVGGVRWELTNHRSRIGEIRTLMLDPAARGHGLATAAIRELVGRLFDERGLHRLECEVYGFNTPAQRMFERAGFLREGVRRRAYHRGGAWQDGVRFALLADERAVTGRPATPR